jgi:hypothetical protein
MAAEMPPPGRQKYRLESVIQMDLKPAFLRAHYRREVRLGGLFAGRAVGPNTRPKNACVWYDAALAHEFVEVEL